ncbi:bifunctional DNA-formamidopyrimidine glycosylase/DNA-(apurinic or apyrimidinic site) lyase [Mycoplasmopsis gallopavonis]|uniref:Formamidopyrimidine-DNA glycosylase n=1 Tax=Mycoplasmopsis gallopavonis TaxID=76629 RepID=A0A449AZA8_9BACT|nr:bifunctional DNA-formamidopyrimidine glycosylase/DNA-(apurinic or apyrimidinic site) lyase [Mycoplasmopsis gallopavonis]RIV16810.1 bifunctional DNA-formamidopyrimidine glycosylase/DNA-(apurinic or apyrimidinic site) lyase [Mycoplasmopsis gallopavonis]VEU72824.1 Formamidopyrimidine-DNA glycosylase [Mycoplasmopsis gallopavonis]
MPEYPEVTVVTRSLNKLVRNETILKIEVRNPKFIHNTTQKEFETQLSNKTILEVKNTGKFIEFILSDHYRILSHLRMAGKYYVCDYREAQISKINIHNYVYFYLTNDKVMIYNDARQFGGFELILPSDQRSLEEIKSLSKLPGETNAELLFRKLQRKTISIKTALLDQKLVLGIGNIYVDEALFAAKVHPMTKCNKISLQELQTILKYAHEIMDESIKHGGSSVHTYQSVNEANGTFQDQLKAYGRAGTICPRCQEVEIVKIKLDYKPNGRGTSFCPKCQVIKD